MKLICIFCLITTKHHHNRKQLSGAEEDEIGSENYLNKQMCSYLSQKYLGRKAVTLTRSENTANCSF